MLTTRVFAFPSGRFLFAKQEPFRCEIPDDLPAVPALPETLLAMELQIRETSVDLRGVSEAVLGDLGATIQILRLAGREYGNAQGRPVRIEDCIADLGLEACLNAAQSGTFAKGALNRIVFEVWTHSRLIAQSCSLLAEEANGIIHPYEAYLAGLLHGMGSLPSLLGWQRNDLNPDRALIAINMAEQWSFPACLKDFFGEVRMPGSNPQLSKIVATAHQLAIDSCSRCPQVDLAAQSRTSTTR